MILFTTAVIPGKQSFCIKQQTQSRRYDFNKLHPFMNLD